MKKIISVFMILALMLSGAVLSQAKDVNYIHSGRVSAKPGETISLPIYIDGNNGFMGFRINLKYDSSVLKAKNVTRGSILSGGMMENSISSKTTDTFSVIYANTDDIKADGVLFTVEFKVDESATKGSYTVSLTYVAEDTFDSGYNPVVFHCDSVKLDISGSGSEPEIDPEPIPEPGFLQKIIIFFKQIIDWIKNLFH